MSDRNRNKIIQAWNYVGGFAHRWGRALYNQYAGNERAQQQLRRR